MGRARNPNDRSAERRSAAQMHALAAVRRDIRAHGSHGPRKYLREFTQAFRKYEHVFTEAELEAKLAASSTILIGDYHALPASQKFAADVIERMALTRRVVLGVEAILSRDQSILDEWWRREISEKTLRERLRFDREWGYRWTPFYELISAARDRGEGIYGLDCLPRHDMRRIRSRDRHAAKKIAWARSRHPNAALVVLFGESHLAPEHLPHALNKTMSEEKTLTVLQNLDAIYWQATSENAPTVSLSENAVCVFNSTPLEKYESYRLCLEKWHGDDVPDFTPAVHNLILSLARTLGFRADSPRNGTQPKFLADSLPEVVQVMEQDSSASLGDNGKASLEQRGCAYVPQSNTLFIREFRMDEVAAEVARFLHHACKGLSQAYEPSEQEAALVHFGSRLLCPNTNESAGDSAGEALYQGYVNGSVTRAELRRMFLARNG